ncbi:peptide MFS transporter [Eisenibacter elegans]|jgi:dipeptide/tripeptide permease|uniref:peptide MFS transporter n=1 Tax=Eisenibacter elegans TaxID=997 RepID=UPI00040E2772|nr:peptide MFS transporter [Eisenibacter elegans]
MNQQDTRFFGHPLGLAFLFFTELWERFSYYGMRAILVLYIYSSIDDGGLGWTQKSALALYGWYTMLVYLMSIPGGYVADKYLGQKRTVMLGGILLCIGHGILAVDALWAFYAGLAFIVMGVGGLKPNISTMVGGLYTEGDPRRDKGFTIFYIGINVGAFIASIIVGYVGETIGWHYGFGLAGIGMLLGQIVFVYGQRYLVGVGDYTPAPKIEGTNRNAPLTKVEKDRTVVLLISFLIVIVFWGAFEQAGGLMNIYAKEKVDRVFFGLFEIPASVFQSVNAFFIITFGTIVAAYWDRRRRKGGEVSSLYKMAIGTIVMGLGFLMMAFASIEASAEPFGRAGMYWLILAYWLHTLGELSASPVALSFITKLAPLKVASLMMGVYFAMTGFGNKVAGWIGEAAQIDPIEIVYTGNAELLQEFEEAAQAISEDKGFSFRAKLYPQTDGSWILETYEDGKPLQQLFALSGNAETVAKDEAYIKKALQDGKATQEKPYHATLRFNKDVEARKIKANKGDGKDYSGTLVIEEVQNRAELYTFLFITVFTVLFGIILIAFLKPLKALTHGAENDKHEE